MRFVIHAVAFLVVIGLGFWAYHENYKTQAALAKTESFDLRISNAHTRLSVLRAEWAYLNRPDRLRNLVEMNYDRLELMPLNYRQFHDLDGARPLPYPAGRKIGVEQAVEVSRAETTP